VGYGYQEFSQISASFLTTNLNYDMFSVDQLTLIGAIYPPKELVEAILGWERLEKNRKFKSINQSINGCLTVEDATRVLISP
jgi:hypothetical protein